MKIGIPREIHAGETRVALTPSLAPLLCKEGHEVLIESGAGARAHFTDAQYVNAGAQVLPDAQALYAQAETVFKVAPPEMNLQAQAHETDLMREGAVCISFLDPLAQFDLTQRLARRSITSYALELIPRISRAQGMDALTSMATVAGYKAVLVAADRLDKMFPLLMTAAGTVAPASVLVLGAGVAGLQAIATAKRLGARVLAFDARPAVREQVQSVGATFLEMDLSENVETAGGYAKEASAAFLQREQQTIAERLPQIDIVISTAKVFGKPAPTLITAEMVRRMRPGAVIVDLAADQGGNCELTQRGQEIEQGGVLIIGADTLPAQVPADASLLYAHNVVNLFHHLYPRTGTPPDSDDEIVREACVTRDGKIVNAAVRTVAEQGAPA